MKHANEHINGLLLGGAGKEIDGGRRQILVSLASLGCSATLGGIVSDVSRAAQSTTQMEQDIERYIKDLRHQGVIQKDEKTAWSVFDFTTEKKLVSINEDVPYQSASMIKPFIALAFFYRVKENKIAYTQESQVMLEAMMQRSSNPATNYIIDLLGNGSKKYDGPEEVQRIITAYVPGIFKNTHITERIPRNGRTYKNQASARDYSRFLYALWHDHLPYSDELKRLMNLPNRDRIRTRAMSAGVRIYDKTGTTSRLCGNMGIVLTADRNGVQYPYTFIGIIEKNRRSKNFSHWVGSRSQVIREVSDLVYRYFKNDYGVA
jgi:beta-lactamase class A